MKRLLSFLLILADYSLASDEIPFPFAGRYESPGSIAREKVDADQWREIPQDVQMRIAEDDNMIELQLLIEVTMPEGSDRPGTYTIANNMWLVKKPDQAANAESGRVDFDVYKINRTTKRFDDLGDGYCQSTECRYHYITAKPDHQQRYRSHLTWQPQHAGREFRQTGDLSAKSTGESEWTTYKTWDNTFRLKTRDP